MVHKACLLALAADGPFEALALPDPWRLVAHLLALQ